ncbi:glutamine ABC transporter ATP-binding protein [Listeria weihenstephanensis FSL R9-0317]|nr:glutamine ABC transporter ATP-binding protein [Listeria weihenstephanensis FSL R9-0317]
MTKLKVTDLKKNFGTNEVLKGINLEVAEGEVVCVIGPSGSGKSTFLRCMNHLEDITAGEVVVDDYNITDKKTDINKVRENIGMVFQHFNLFPHMSVLKNITLAPTELSKQSKEDAKKSWYGTLNTRWSGG